MAGRRTAEACRWFQQAPHDLQAARWNSEGGFHDTACFLAQQAPYARSRHAPRRGAGARTSSTSSAPAMAVVIYPNKWPHTATPCG